MILKEIFIKNFKSHSNTRIRFESGINLIAGRNGAGKSSILEAILVALYGVRPPLRKEDILQIGATEYTIELIFELNGRDYRIIRRSSGNSELRGDFYLEGDKRINEWVERNVSPFHVFTGAIYVRQGEIETIISDESGREKIIRKITRIEDYENAWKNIGQIIRELEMEMKKYTEILKQKDECELKLKEKVTEIEKLREEIGMSEKKLEEYTKEYKRILEEKNSFDRIKEEISQLKENILHLEGEIKSLRNKIDVLQTQKRELEVKRADLKKRYERMLNLEKEAKKYSEIESLYKEITKTLQELNERVKNLEIERERILNEIKRYEEEKENLEKIRAEIAELKKRVEILKPDFEKWEKIKIKVERKMQIEKILSEKGFSAEKIDQMFLVIQKAREKDKNLKEEFSRVSMEKGSLNSEKKRMEEVIDKLKNLKGVCPICGRELTEEHREELLKKYFSEIEKIKVQLMKIDEKERRLREEKNRVEEVLGKQDIVLKYKQLVDELRKIAEEIKDVNIEKLKEKSNEIERIISRISFLEDLEKKSLKVVEKHMEVKKKLESIETGIFELENAKKALKDRVLKYGFQSVEDLEKAISELRNSYEEWVSLRSSESELKEVEKRLKDLEEELRKCIEILSQRRKEYEAEKGKIEELERKYDREKHLKLEEREKSISKEIAGLKERLEALKRTMEVLIKDRDYLEKQMAVIKESERRLRAIERAIPELEKIREKFLSYKNRVAEVAMKEVEKYASEIFEEFTDGKYSGVKLKRVFEYGKERLKIFVLHHGEERETNFLSGGELIALGIAFRLALSMFEAKGRIPLLILDEPTPFLDEERRKKLVEIMTNYLRRIPQVIVVSHDEELKDAADRIIAVDYRGGVSVVEN